MSTTIKLVITFLFLVVNAPACNNPMPSTTINHVTTVTPFTLPPTWTPSPTLLSKTTPTIIPTLTFTSKPTLIPTSTLRLGWFQLTELSPAESISSKTARSFIGIKIPPLPDHLIQEFSFEDVIGEAPPSTIIHQAVVMRQGNARMLWIGVQFWPTNNGSEVYTRIYDSIPIPETRPDDILIAFTCVHNNESDFSLIVIASRPKGEEPATDIHYAWRIDPTTTTLQSVNYRDIECWSY